MNENNQQEMMERADRFTRVMFRAIFGIEPEVNVYEDEKGITVEITGPQTHMGHFMGRQSQTITALRRLFFIWGSINHAKMINLIVADNKK